MKKEVIELTENELFIYESRLYYVRKIPDDSHDKIQCYCIGFNTGEFWRISSTYAVEFWPNTLVTTLNNQVT